MYSVGEAAQVKAVCEAAFKELKIVVVQKERKKVKVGDVAVEETMLTCTPCLFQPVDPDARPPKLEEGNWFVSFSFEASQASAIYDFIVQHEIAENLLLQLLPYLVRDQQQEHATMSNMRTLVCSYPAFVQQLLNGKKEHCNKNS